MSTNASYQIPTGYHRRSIPTGLYVPVDRAALAVMPRSRSEVANRTLNIVLASLALVVLAPVMLLIALAVKLTSPGPILYSQTRVGMDRRMRRALALYDRRSTDIGGTEFVIYKFR